MAVGSISTVGIKGGPAHRAVGQSSRVGGAYSRAATLYWPLLTFTRRTACGYWSGVARGNRTSNQDQSGPMLPPSPLDEGEIDMDALITLLVIVAGLALLDPIGLGMAALDD